MKFRNDKIESTTLIQDDSYTQTCAILIDFSEKYGTPLLGTSTATRAVLSYNRDADGVSNSPYYRLVAIYDLKHLDNANPIESTVKKWYDDVPMIEPLAWIANNIV